MPSGRACNRPVVPRSEERAPKAPSRVFLRAALNYFPAVKTPGNASWRVPEPFLRGFPEEHPHPHVSVARQALTLLTD